MDYGGYILIGLVAVFLLLRILPTKGVKQITTVDLSKELQQKQKQFIDVRTPAEFKARHISGFQNIPLHQLNNKTINKLSKKEEVIVLCQSGMRSNKACKTLKKMGFEKVTNVRGGISQWNN